MKIVNPATYNSDYFERGPIVGVSSYMNYSWMPELTIRMAHKFILSLPISDKERVLDFGCAKGFLVKALRILEIDAYGVDISEYAIANADGDVREYCTRIAGCEDPNLFAREYDWLIAKDVMEHLGEEDLSTLLTGALPKVRRIFSAVPLAADDVSGKYIVPEYDRDITHVIAKSFGWWRRTFERHGWKVLRESHWFPGCKENWTSQFAEGNGFFVLARASDS